MRRLLVGLGVLLVVISPALAGAGDARPVTGAMQLEVLHDESCPVRLLADRSRVVDPNNPRSLAPRDRRPLSRALEAGEQQIVFETTFRNESDRPVSSVEFRWEALSTANVVTDIREFTYQHSPVRPGSTRRAHNVSLKFGADVSWYRLLVRRVEFSDGTTWVTPREAAYPDAR